jgi:hypothetical protein
MIVRRGWATSLRGWQERFMLRVGVRVCVGGWYKSSHTRSWPQVQFVLTKGVHIFYTADAGYVYAALVEALAKLSEADTLRSRYGMPPGRPRAASAVKEVGGGGYSLILFVSEVNISCNRRGIECGRVPGRVRPLRAGDPG